MNIVLLNEADRTGGVRFVLTDERATHVAAVLKKTPNERLRVGLTNGPLGTATVVECKNERVVIDVAFGSTPTRPTVSLIVAVPRPKSLRRLLRDSAALGVERITLVRTWRVDKAYLGSPLLEPTGYIPLLAEGLMQARDTHLPELVIESRFKPFVEDRAPALAEGRLAAVLHPGADTPHLAKLPIDDGPIVIAIGPEGGFSDYEVEAFERAGFVHASLGPRILRVETACAAALSCVAAVRAAD